MRHCKGYTVEQLLGAQLEASFSPKLKHEWTVASEDINTPPTMDELLEFLEKRLLNLPNEGIKLTVPSSSSTSSNNQSSKKARVSHVKSKENKITCSAWHNNGHRIYRAPPLKNNLPSNGNRKSKISISASTVWHLDTLLHNATTKDVADSVDVPTTLSYLKELSPQPLLIRQEAMPSSGTLDRLRTSQPPLWQKFVQTRLNTRAGCSWTLALKCP